MVIWGEGGRLLSILGSFVIQSVSSVYYHVLSKYYLCINICIIIPCINICIIICISTMYHRPPTVNTMYHPQWYVTRGWYNIILHSTCITMDRLSIITNYHRWYNMIHYMIQHDTCIIKEHVDTLMIRGDTYVSTVDGVDTWMIHCINSAQVAGWRWLCWYIVDT